MLLYSEVIIIKIYKNLLPFEALLSNLPLLVPRKTNKDLAWIKIGFELFAADLISLLVEGVLPKAGQMINVIKVYLPMESITSDSFPIGGSRNEMCLSPARKRWESQRSLMRPCRSLFRSPAWNLTRPFFYFFHFPRVMWNYDSSW